MADPGDPQPADRTVRWDRVPERGGLPFRGRPPVPGTRATGAALLTDDRPYDDGPYDSEQYDDGQYDSEQYDDGQFDDGQFDDGQFDDGPYDDPSDHRPGPRGPWRTVALGLGELLVTMGAVLLLFVVYEVHVTDLLTAQRQDELAEELREEWESAPGADGRDPITRVELGDAFAVLRIPRLGEDYTRVVLEGTQEEQLSQGPGHYVGSALPGEEGNLALAGHRVGKGSPFLDLDAMRPGDPIVVEDADSWFVYRVLGDPATGDVDTDPSGIPGVHVVSPSAVEVTSPTPNAAASAPPSGAYLTLTTCHPRYSARQRLIVHARLDGGALSKAEYPDGPDALYENR